jgi:hypothetical protein
MADGNSSRVRRLSLFLSQRRKRPSGFLGFPESVGTTDWAATKEQLSHVNGKNTSQKTILPSIKFPIKKIIRPTAANAKTIAPLH